MLRINPYELKSVLHSNIFDYCMLLPVFDGCTHIETYISQSNERDFLCYILHNDGNATLDIRWCQSHMDEILELLIHMKNNNYFHGECAVCLYKENGLLKHLESVCKIENIRFETSYYSDCPATPCLKDLQIESKSLSLQESFLNQTGNHINIIKNQVQNDPDNNHIFYLNMTNETIGYIALTKQYENIWDVAYIFIDENHRNKGYGTQLCIHAIEQLHTKNRILYYSYCENIDSKCVALKSGLKPCAERYIFCADFKGISK